MNKKLLLCLSLALSSGLVSEGFAQDSYSMQSVERRTVGSINVKVENLPPGSSFDKQTVLAKLRTRPGDPFSQYVFDQDLKQLAEEYDRVEPEVETSGNVVNITLKIWVRPIIGNIEWRGNENIKTRTLRKELDMKPGVLFNRSEFNRAFNKVKEYYIKKGYFESQLSYRLVPIPDTQEVTVEINIIEGRAGKVDDIVFHGFTKKEESEILQKFYTKKYFALFSWFTGMGKFNEEALEQDRLTIFNYLQDQGYADARVSIQILPSPKKGKIIIDISADKGCLYHFGQVSFDGNILFSDEEIERIFSARPDEVYSPERLRKTAEAIKDLYGRKGFIDTSVTYETQLVQDMPIYNVHFLVEEGREYKIGMIRIIGNVQTEDRVILRESLLVPGESFDSLKLKITQARLENIGYFKSVNVYAVRTQDDLALGDNYRDIYIEVEETQTGSVSLFSGFSSAENIYGGLDMTERNFNYKGLAHIFSDGLGAVRGGGEFFHLRANFGKAQQSYLASWMSPYFQDTLWRFGFDLNASLNNRQVSEGEYRVNTYNLGTYFNYPLTPYWTYGVRYRIGGTYVSKVDEELLNSGSIKEATGVISGISSSIVYDSTDRALKPHRGLRSLLEGEVVGLGGDFSFAKATYQNAYYTPLLPHGYMRYRWEFRFLFPFGWTNNFTQIPVSERYYLGGANSVRGYKDFVLGPTEKKFDKDGIESADVPTGGISSSLLSIEYIHEIFPFLDVFAFMDAGYVSNKVFDFGTYRMSYGIGATIEILGRMPITIGYGFPVNPREDQTRNFFFTLGGQF